MTADCTGRVKYQLWSEWLEGEGKLWNNWSFLDWRQQLCSPWLLTQLRVCWVAGWSILVPASSPPAPSSAFPFHQILWWHFQNGDHMFLENGGHSQYWHPALILSSPLPLRSTKSSNGEWNQVLFGMSGQEFNKSRKIRQLSQWVEFEISADTHLQKATIWRVNFANVFFISDINVMKCYNTRKWLGILYLFLLYSL